MENGERKARVSLEAKARRKNKKRKPEKATNLAACTPGISTSSDLTSSRPRMTPTKEARKSNAGTGEAAVGALEKTDGGREGREGGGGAMPLFSVSGKKRPREGEKVATAVQSGTSKHHPFPTEYGDHFETPLQAYRDIEGALTLLSKLLGKKRKHLRIWDPYVSAVIPTEHCRCDYSNGTGSTYTSSRYVHK